MFKTAETGATLSDAKFRKLKDRLRLELILAQQKVRARAQFPVIIVLAGVRGAGVIDTLNLLNTWMDPRWIHTVAADAPSEEETERPAFWRYWRTLPAAGTMGLYLGGWYSDPIAGYGGGHHSRETFDAHMRHIRSFERLLADDGALILKFWLHLSSAKHHRQKDAHRTDPVFGFRASDTAWPETTDYKPYIAAAARGIEATHDAQTPWHVVDGTDDNFRRAEVLTVLHKAMHQHLKTWKKRGPPKSKTPAAPVHRRVEPLAQVDLAKSLDARTYAEKFAAHQHRLYAAQKAAHEAGIPTVIAFEGWDAAGKGGAIRRLTFGLSAYNYNVVSIAQPNTVELQHHYLWRFWRHIPRDGRITIFDRSWYGRVLVERVEKLIPKPVWRRAYGEIISFEDELIDSGAVFLKFFLHIDRQEQRKRLEDRRDTPHKRWKLSDDDWRAHKKWDEYYDAINDMIVATARKAAPWYVVPAVDKQYARITVLDTVATALERAVKAKKP